MKGIRPSFAYALTLTRSKLGWLRVNFCKYVTHLWPLVVKIYLVNEMMEFDQILHMHSP